MRSPAVAARCHFFSTFFWKKLSLERTPAARHAAVAKWTRGVDVFAKHFLFVRSPAPLSY